MPLLFIGNWKQTYYSAYTLKKAKPSALVFKRNKVNTVYTQAGVLSFEIGRVMVKAVLYLII